MGYGNSKATDYPQEVKIKFKLGNSIVLFDRIPLNSESTDDSHDKNVLPPLLFKKTHYSFIHNILSQCSPIMPASID